MNNGRNRTGTRKRKRSESGNGDSSSSPRNDVSSLRIQMPPIRNEWNDHVVSWYYKSKKYRAAKKGEIDLEEIVDTIKTMQQAQIKIIDRLMERATTPGRFNPADARLLRQVNEEYNAYMDLFFKHVKPRGA
jgi:hypothetical protein